MITLLRCTRVPFSTASTRSTSFAYIITRIKVWLVVRRGWSGGDRRFSSRPAIGRWRTLNGGVPGVTAVAAAVADASEPAARLSRTRDTVDSFVSVPSQRSQPGRRARARAAPRYSAHVALVVATLVFTMGGWSHVQQVVNAAVSAGELAALVDLRNASGFPSSLSTWASGDPCANSWFGVACSSAPVAVTYVDRDL